MAIFRPFRGLRPAAGQAHIVAALPYDVMDEQEARAIVADNPDSFLRITRAEVDLPSGSDAHSAAAYAQAQQNLADFRQRGLLIQDQQPCFYIYKQRMADHEQIGVVGVAAVDEYEQGIVRKHELTRPDKEQDRIDHILATRAQTGTVFLTYKETPAVTNAVNLAMTSQPVAEFTAADGIAHSLYVVTEPNHIAQLEQAFAKVDILYIADGHHRSAAAARVREILRRQNPQHDGQETYNFFLATAFPHTMVKIFDYNRVVADLAGLSEQEFLTAVSQNFTVTAQSASYQPHQPGVFGMYLNGQWYQLAGGKPAAANLTASLDVSILQDQLLTPILAIKDVRTDTRISFVGGIRGLQELERLVDSGRYAVAFALYPTAVSELLAVADAGEIMPPKSTWFEPKLRDAMAIHLID